MKEYKDLTDDEKQVYDTVVAAVHATAAAADDAANAAYADAADAAAKITKRLLLGETL